MKIETRIKAAVTAGIVTSLLAMTGAAQQPKVNNAQVTTHSGNLQREVATAKASTWIGYSIPTRREVHTGWNDDVQYLEGTPKSTPKPQRKPGDPQPSAVVLLRVTDGKIGRIQIEDRTREIDAGGLPFVWLTDIAPTESIAVLKSAIEQSAAEVHAATPVTVVSTNDRDADRARRNVERDEERKLRRVEESGLLAISLTEAPEATSALRSFTDARYPSQLRERAAFWLVNQQGSEGLSAITQLLKTEKDEAFRVKLVFDLTLVREPSATDPDTKVTTSAAINALIDLAKNDPSAKVRSQAQFWLAEQARKKLEPDARIVATLGEQAKSDPEASMRKSAVFALSRLPEDQGIPQLIQVASTSKDIPTRREAIFWLGRSKDPRALAYLEKVVKE